MFCDRLLAKCITNFDINRAFPVVEVIFPANYFCHHATNTHQEKDGLMQWQYFMKPWLPSVPHTHDVVVRDVVAIPDSKVHGANTGPIWGRQEQGGPHVGPMNFDIWDISSIHWDRDKMADIFQTTFSNALSWVKMFEFKVWFA